ncbi:MAG: non-ribosomal peptide synthetase, partial [bacterium]|nr:non-ribosomal peptide synthetase [bacterium]
MSDVTKRIVGLSPAKRRVLRQRLIKIMGAASEAPIPRRPRGRGPLPLAFGQERLWFIAELEPESRVYNTFYALRFRGELAVPALAASFLDVVGRHESLRTTFAAPDGRPIQVVHAAPPAFPPPAVSLERLPPADRAAAAKRLAAAAADPVFDLARGPLLRPVLMRLAPREHILLIIIHHIVSDGWSLGVLMREVAAFYQARTTGRPSPLPELPIQYADFALWQRQWLVGEVLDEEVAYWRRKLAGAPPRLELPCDRPRALRRSYRGTTLGLRLEPELTAALRALSSEQGSTLFVTLLTGFAILLGR